MKILVTGGAGYIGTHTVVELIKAGYEVVIVDNFVNSKKIAIDRLNQIVGKKVPYYEIDVCDYNKFEKVFIEQHIDGVIHFAGLKCVPESIEKPLLYYSNNLEGTFVLLELMKKYQVHNLVFSSSATVYGEPKQLPLKEDFPLSATNTYGRTKLFIENILVDECNANSNLNVAILRYFNPVGAHESGLIGEDPNGIPNNLVPYVSQVAVGKLPFVKVTGNDFDTKDGTGVRDYIHVCDLAYGHVLALTKLFSNCGLVTYNLGTGKGFSVLDIIHAYSKAINKDIPYKFFPRRKGDIATCYADVTKAYNEIGFKAKYSLEQMVSSAYNFQVNNPEGYK